MVSNGTPSNGVVIYHYAMTPQVDVPLSLVYMVLRYQLLKTYMKHNGFQVDGESHNLQGGLL
jgi:hypothetical protein